MTAHRDARGRFTTAANADVAAAERVLEAAVREAIQRLRWLAVRRRYESDLPRIVKSTWFVTVSSSPQPEPRDFYAEAEAILAHAAHAAEPLLRSAS